MSEELYGQGALLDGLVPELVGLRRRRVALWEQRSKPAFGGCGPVVHVGGGRASGKTALLDALYDDYNGRLPLARADLAAPDFGDKELAGLDYRAESRTASPLTHLLYLLRYRLGLRTRGGGLTFPRLSLGLLVATTWLPADTRPDIAPKELLRAQQELYSFVMAAPADSRRRRELLHAWLRNLAANLAHVVPVPGLDILVQPTLDTARKLLLGVRARRPVRWWRDQLPGQGDGVDRLVGFAVDFQRLGSRRREAEEHLLAAFLDDVDAEYGPLRSANRAALPLVLLDNVHAGVGPDLLRLLQNRYAAAADGGARPVHPVIVATALGDPRAGRGFAEAHGERPWRRADDGWVLRLRINEVRTPDVRRMLRNRLGVAPYPDDLERTIARLSGGRAGCARVLVEAVVARLRAGGGTGTVTGPELLTLPCADGRNEPVADRLRQLLLPERLTVRLQNLALAAAALDEAEALRLLRATGDAGPQHDRIAANRLATVARVLRAAHWRRDPWPAPAAPLVVDRSLRTLLLHHLADPRAAHGVLAAPGDEPPAAAAPGPEAAWRSDAFRLHHALALGDTGTVAARLRELFDELAPAAWLTVVNIVCAAPRPPAGTADAAEDPGDELGLWIGRLVRALWRLSDPLVLTPDDADITEVTDALRGLRGQPGSDPDDVYLAAETSWPRELRDGVQAPDLSVPPGPQGRRRPTGRGEPGGNGVPGAGSQPESPRGERR